MSGDKPAEESNGPAKPDWKAREAEADREWEGWNNKTEGAIQQVSTEEKQQTKEKLAQAIAAKEDPPAELMPKSKGSQESKEAAHLLQPAFIQELRKKAVEYFIGADQFKSSAKRRFPKNITEDPLFQAIAYLRNRGRAEERLRQDFASAEDQDFQRFSIRKFYAENKLDQKGLLDILDELFGPPEPGHAKLLAVTCIAAVRGGRLNDIAELCEIFEKRTYRRGRLSRELPWEYYAAVAALGFLNKGTIPLKKEVKEAALRERAIMELPVMYRVGTEEPLPKLQEAGEPKELRIDPEPAPDQDPDSYYGAPDENPDSELLKSR